MFSSFGLDNVDIYLRDGLFISDFDFVSLRLSKRSLWVVYINENFFDSYRCSPPQKLSKINIKRNEYCLYSEYKIQGLPAKRDSFCSRYCL